MRPGNADRVRTLARTGDGSTFPVKHVYTNRAGSWEGVFHVKRVVQVIQLFHVKRFESGGNRRRMQAVIPPTRPARSRCHAPRGNAAPRRSTLTSRKLILGKGVTLL